MAEPRWPPVTYWMRATAGVLAILGLARLLLAIGNILILLLISLVLAIGFQPAIDWLGRRGLKRPWAVAAIFVTGAVVVLGFLALVMPIIIRELGGLVQDAPGYLERARQDSELFQRLDTQFDLMNKLEALGREIPATALSLIRSFGSLVFNGLTVLVLTLYFMAGMPRIRRAGAALLRRQDRDEFEEILEESTQRVGGYVLGNLAISLVAGVVSFLALSVIGVPYPAVLAFFVALMDLIPSVGATIGALVAVTVAAFAGVGQVIGSVIFFTAYQQVENFVIAPRVMRKAVDMSAATVILAVLIGATLLGFVGALLAIPLAAIVKTSLRVLYLDRRRP